MWKRSSKSNLRTLPNVKMMKKKNGANDRINTTNIDLIFSCIKLFEVIIEVTRSTLTLENIALFVCIYGLKSHLKCSFLQYLEEKTNLFPAEPCFCILCMKCLSKCFCSKKPILPRKIPVCAPVIFNFSS